MGAGAVTLTSENWASEVEQSELPVLVDFGASWCPPCKAIAPTIEALASELAGRVKVAKIDVDDEPGLAERYGIRSVPTLLILDRGRVVDQRLGAAAPAVLKAFAEAHAPARRG